MRNLRYLALVGLLFLPVAALAQPGEGYWDTNTFEVPIARFATELKPAFYRGRKLNADDPKPQKQPWLDGIEAAKKFPDTLSCLSFEPGDVMVSLAKLNSEAFKNLVEIEICLQCVGSELSDFSHMGNWLRAIGFEWVEMRDLSPWLGSEHKELQPVI